MLYQALEMDGAYFCKKRPVSGSAGNPQSGHSRGMSCDNYDLANLLQDSTLPDPDLVGLIGQAFLEGQIDSQVAEMAICC